MNFSNNGWCTLNKYTNANGTKKLARYRWNYLTRSANRTANNYTNVFNLIDAANAPPNANYQYDMETDIDMEQWMRTFAVEHAAGNWDTFGGAHAQNMYAYKGQSHKWTLFMWDFEVVLGNSGSDGPAGDDLFRTNPDDPVMQQIYSFLPFRRAYWRAMKEIVNGPLVSAKINPILDAKYAAFTAEGLNVADPAGVKSWLATRHDYIASQVAAVDAPFSVFGTNRIVTNNNLVTLRGTAPLVVQTSRIGGVEYPITWSSLTEWTLTVPVFQPTNSLVLMGFDRNGATRFTNTTIVEYQGPMIDPVNHVVINEIMCGSATPGSGYVEFFNTATNFTFDLSGWVLSGAGSNEFIFPDATIIEPRQFLVLAVDRRIFPQTYGHTIPLVRGQLGEALNPDSGLITLAKRGLTACDDTIIDKIKYESVLPWPVCTNQSGCSLQVIDPSQDNSRVSNWAAAPPSPGQSNSVMRAMTPYPNLWINEILPNNQTGVSDRSGIHEPWIELFNAGSEAVAFDGYYLANSYSNVLRWPFPSGTTIEPNQTLLVWADGEPGQSISSELHANFRLDFAMGSVALARVDGGQEQILDYINYSGLPADTSYGSYPDGQAVSRQVFTTPSPGGTNIVTTQIFINEWMASNKNTVNDAVDGDAEDWFELYNPNGNPVDLSGYVLADLNGFTNGWSIPNCTFIPAHGFLLVWADDETNQNKPRQSELHGPAKLSKEGDRIQLFAPDGRLIDRIDFGLQQTDVSEGRFPDGSSNIFQFTQFPTPAAPNIQDPYILLLPYRPTIEVGETLRFTVAVSNAPTPPFILTFLLSGNVPTGASIDPCNGKFTWTPTAAQFGTRHIDVGVVNNGPPFFTLEGGLDVIVTGIPQFTGISPRAEGGYSLSWNCKVGKSFRLQYCSDLGLLDWRNLGDVITATGPSVTFIDPETGVLQRFYRILQLN